MNRPLVVGSLGVVILAGPVYSSSVDQWITRSRVILGASDPNHDPLPRPLGRNTSGTAH